MIKRVLKGPRRLNQNSKNTTLTKRKTGYAVKHNNYKAKHPEIYGCKIKREPTVKRTKEIMTLETKINSELAKLTGNLEYMDFEDYSEDELVADLLS